MTNYLSDQDQPNESTLLDWLTNIDQLTKPLTNWLTKWPKPLLINWPNDQLTNYLEPHYWTDWQGLTNTDQLTKGHYWLTDQLAKLPPGQPPVWPRPTNWDYTDQDWPVITEQLTKNHNWLTDLTDQDQAIETNN